MWAFNRIARPSSTDCRRIYDALHRSGDLAQTNSFYRWLLKRLPARREGKLLDVACGCAGLAQMAVRQGLQAHGTDFSFLALRTVVPRHPPFLTVSDGEALPYRGESFDYLTSIGSLEHYIHPLAGIEEMARVLKPDGRALLLLPNTFSLLHNVWGALRNGRTGLDRQPIQRYAALREWQDLLEEGGFRVCKVYKYEKEFPRSLKDAFQYLLRPKELLRLLLTPLVPLPWAFAFVYLCQKRTGRTSPEAVCSR